MVSVVLVPRSTVVGQAVQAALRHHYYQPVRQPQRRYLPPPLVIPGPVFALVQPVTYFTLAQQPEHGAHLQGQDHDPVALGTEWLLVLFCVFIGGRLIITRAFPMQPDWPGGGK